MNSFLFCFLTFYAFRSFVFTGSKLSKSHFQFKSEKDIVPLRKESDREGIMYLNTCTLKAKVITCIDFFFLLFFLIVKEICTSSNKVLWIQKLRFPVQRTQDYQRFSLSSWIRSESCMLPLGLNKNLFKYKIKIQ